MGAYNFPYEGRLQLAINIGNSLIRLDHLADAKSFLQQTLHTAVAVMGPTAKSNDVRVLNLRAILNNVCYRSCKSRKDLVEVEKAIAEVYANELRLLGPSHPQTLYSQGDLELAREVLARIETSK